MYIGITGFRTRQECETVLASVRPLPSTVQLHIGVMTGRKKLSNIPSKWNTSFLSLAEMAQIFSASADVLNCVHYADYSNAQEPLNVHILRQHLQSIIEGVPHLNAIQLDMVLPPPEALNPLMLAHPHVDWILQLNPETFEQMGSVPNLLAYLQQYTRVRYLLLDFSKGTGKPLDITQLLHIKSQIPMHYEVVFAGGLGPQTLQLLGVAKGTTSIDAQGQLMQLPANKYNPFLDISRSIQYVKQAVKAY